MIVKLLQHFGWKRYQVVLTHSGCYDLEMKTATLDEAKAYGDMRWNRPGAAFDLAFIVDLWDRRMVAYYDPETGWNK